MGIILCTLSHVMHVGEKFVICLAAAGIVSCMVFTFTMMLVLGIGLGYNYCFVDFKTRHKYVPGYYKYTVLPATTTFRTIRYRPPYPTLYPPQNEWFQIYPRRSNIENETLEFNIEDLNGTDFDKLNVSLDLNSLNKMFNDMKYNNSLPEGMDYYGNVDAESKSFQQEISTMTTPLHIPTTPTLYPMAKLVFMTSNSTLTPVKTQSLMQTSTLTPAPTMPTPTPSIPEPPTQTLTSITAVPTTTVRAFSENVMDKISNHTKTVLHLNGLDLFALLAKLRSENKNYTVKIETN